MSGFRRAQTIYDAISGRRSIRQYSSDDVSPDTIRRLISMAVMAPSAHNRQQWPFVVARAESRTRRTPVRLWAVLDDAAFGAATDVVPKFVSPADPAARWTGAHGGQAFFAYSTAYLIDVDLLAAGPTAASDR